MQKAKQIDETAGRIGRAMMHARHALRIPRDEAASLLHLLPNELSEYERAITKIPQDILERMFLLGYRMMRFRTLEDKYRLQRKFYRKLKDTIDQVP